MRAGVNVQSTNRHPRTISPRGNNYSCTAAVLFNESMSKILDCLARDREESLQKYVQRACVEVVRRLIGSPVLSRATTKLATSRTTPDRIAVRNTTLFTLSAALRMITVAESRGPTHRVEKILECLGKILERAGETRRFHL